MEPEILNIALPDVTINDVFQAEGADYSRRPPRESQVKLHRKVLQEALELVHPIAIWTEVAILGAGNQEVFLEGEFKLTSGLLAKMGKSAQKLCLLAMTLGPALDNRVATYQQNGNMAEAFILDMAGSAIIAKTGPILMKALESRYQQQGLKTTFPMGPGHSYWKDLADQKVLFKLLQPERIGLQLNSSNLMLPRKSVSMVMAIGNKLPEFEGKTHCDFCTLQSNCNMYKVQNKVGAQ